ncbi:hypothetical protein [Rickettsia endosymbiont of Orchestes rusci]
MGRSPDVASQEKISTKCYEIYYFPDCRTPSGYGFVAWMVKIA